MGPKPPFFLLRELPTNTTDRDSFSRHYIHYYLQQYRWEKEENTIEAWDKDDFSALINRATNELKPVAITLKSRKVYIGLVARTNEPDGHQSHITILPYYSGYRDEEKLHLHITNKYTWVFKYYSDSPPKGMNIEDFYIVIPLERILSAHIFNFEIYKQINDYTDES